MEKKKKLKVNFKSTSVDETHTIDDFLKKRPRISHPKNVVQMMTVKIDPNSPLGTQFIFKKGLVGLPKEWEEFILQSGMKKQELLENPKTTAVLEFYRGSQRKISTHQNLAKIIEKKLNHKPQLEDFIEKVDPKNIFEDLVYLDEGCFGKVFKAKHKKLGIYVF